MGILTVQSGRILLQDRDITRLPTYERARLGIGYAPEDAGIFPDLTVAENFQMSQSLGAARKRARRASEVDERVFDLFPEVRQFLSRRGLNLSGGQKKMVAIARALTLSPSILLLDEPFEGLAPVVVSRFIEATRRIKEMGVSLLIAESNLATASRIADRLYAIDRGEIIFEGPSRRRDSEPGGHAHPPRVVFPPGRPGPRRRFAANERSSAWRGRWRASPTRQERATTATDSAMKISAVVTRDRLARKARVPLDSPANASPTTGITGAPQPMTLHGPVDSPTTLASIPATPPRWGGAIPARGTGAFSRRCARARSRRRRGRP